MTSLWRVLHALVFALWGHRGQKDKAGVAYWRHLVTVAWTAYGMTHSAEAAVVGLLHDYMEDVCGDNDCRIYRKFGESTARRLRWLTRYEEEDYETYIGMIAINADAIVLAVKISDLLHNTRPGRMVIRAPGYPVDGGMYDKGNLAEMAARVGRYDRALKRLTTAWAGLGLIP